MAFTLSADSSESISLREFVDHVSAHVDVRDTDQLLEAADLLRALGNNPSLLADELNAELRTSLNSDSCYTADGYSAQTLLLARGPGFVVRANIWLPPAATAAERDSQRRLNSYQLPHDHDFSFLTVGYWGSGYATSIWEYDPNSVVGLPREHVDLTFLEDTTLPRGKVMFYRASRDVHSQEYPEELSVSLNLLVLPEEGPSAQYMFDPAEGVITGIVPNAAQNRVSLCWLAQHLGNGETADRLDALARAHPEPHLRWAAYRSLLALERSAAEDVLAPALVDDDAFVRTRARELLR